MSDPFRLAVLKALAAGIESRVVGSGGYTFDLTDASFYGRATYGNNDPATMCNVIEDVREQEISDTSVVGKGREVPWKLLLQGITDDDATEPTGPAYRLAAELNMAVAALAAASDGIDTTILGNRRKTNRVEQFHIGPTIVMPLDNFVAKTICLIPLTLDLYETPSAPFT